MARTTVNLPGEQLTRMRKRAKEHGWTLGEEMRVIFHLGDKLYQWSQDPGVEVILRKDGEIDQVITIV